MNDLVVADRATEWRRLRTLVLDSVSSPITKRVYNFGLNEFFAWYGREPRPGFTAVRELAVEAADNGLLAPNLAAGITRVKGAASKGVRCFSSSGLPFWTSTFKSCRTSPNCPDRIAIR